MARPLPGLSGMGRVHCNKNAGMCSFLIMRTELYSAKRSLLSRRPQGSVVTSWEKRDAPDRIYRAIRRARESDFLKSARPASIASQTHPDFSFKPP
jgi:hypothetical protein